MDRRELLKGIAVGALSAEALSGAPALAQSPAPAPQNRPPRRPENTWPGKKLILAIADPVEWYSSAGYHHDSASHTLATVERLGRQSGLWTTIIRTDMSMLTKQPPVPGSNVRNLNDFDAVFYMGEGPWNISDQQKADLLSFVHEDGKGFIAGHAGNGGHLLLWPEYAAMIGGNLIGEFPTADMPIILEDPKFPGVQHFPKAFKFKDQYTIVGLNFSRDVDHVIMRMDPTKFKATFDAIQPPPGSRGTPEQYRQHFEKLAALRTDGDYPIVWARKYGKGRVWYSTFGHLEQTLDDARIQEMYIGAIKWALGLVDADITPRPLPVTNH